MLLTTNDANFTLTLQIGGHLVFETATVDQHRNPHRLLLDFADELDLLLHFTQDWV